MRRPAFKYATVIVGLLAALAIMFSQAFSSNNYSKKNVETEQTSAHDSNEKSGADEKSASFSISATSFQPSGQFGFVQQAICLFEIVFASDQPDAEVDLETLPLGTFFSTILRVLISPNAP